MSAASENLKHNQRQLDMDGVEVGVSRQALDETLEQYEAMLAALQAWSAHRLKVFDAQMRGTLDQIPIDGIKKIVDAADSAIAEAEGRAS